MSTSMLAETDPVEKELPLSGAVLTDLLQSVLAKDRLFRFRAKGSSMYPFIRDGDVILIAPLRQVTPRLGDVVACLRSDTDRFMVHRIVRRRENAFLTQGDNAFCDDGWFSRESILGRVIRIERKGKAVHFGLGVERLMIVALARRGWLPSVVHCRGWRLVLPVARRMRS